MSGFNFNFNLENFGLGLLTGWGTAYALYRARNLLAEATGSVGSQARRAQEFASRSADAGYIHDLVRMIQKDHVAGNRIALSDILVEPRFLKAPDFAAPLEEDIVRDVFTVVPRVHDHPYLHAPYNLHSLSVAELDNGDRALALLGLPGSGRTTALHAIALWSAGEVDFEDFDDPMQARLEAEEKAMKSREESARRYTERMRVEDIAKEALADKQGVNQEALKANAISLFRQMTPMYTHLANINVSIAEFGRNQDPAEALVRALQVGVSYGTRMKLAKGLYERLEEGKVLLLLDGLDELPLSEQLLKLEWLRHLREAYSSNFIIVTGSVRGYGGLIQAGYTPVFLRPFQDTQTDTLANQWAKHWGRLSGGRRRNVEIDRETIQRIKTKARAYTPLELALRAWSMYDDPLNSDISTWMNNYLRQRLGTDKLDALLPQIIKAAQLQLDEGFIMPEPLDRALLGAEAITATLETSAVGAIISVDSLDSDLDEIGEFAIEDDLDSLAAELEGGQLDDEDKLEVDDLLGVLDVTTQIPLDEKNRPRISKETTQFLKQMRQAGIFKQYRGGRYQFAHPLIAAYFGSFALQGLRFDKLLKKSFVPAWQDALMYAASHTPMDALARHRMEAPVDLLLNNLLDTVQWVRYASGTVEWLPSMMRVLGKLFASRSQYLAVRERIAAALVGSYDQNALRIFEKSLGHPDPDVRRLSCLALGALRNADAVDAIINKINDKDGFVQIAAVLALGAIGTQDSLEEMAVTLTQSTEAMRQAAAEAFAANPEVGYPTLYDAINNEDMMMRRAAVFGLRRIRSPWSLISIYEASLNDDQWYVRSAAEQAFMDMQFGDIVAGPKRYPRIDQIPWLMEWIASLGDAGRMLTGKENLLLRRALEQGDPEMQALAVSNMGQLGLYDQTGLIYTALRHREPSVRDVAYRSLAELQLQVDEELPAPLAVS